MLPGVIFFDAIIQLKQGDGGNMQLFELNLLNAGQYFRRVLFNQVNADSGIQQVTRLRKGNGWLKLSCCGFSGVIISL